MFQEAVYRPANWTSLTVELEELGDELFTSSTRLGRMILEAVRELRTNFQDEIWGPFPNLLFVQTGLISETIQRQCPSLQTLHFLDMDMDMDDRIAQPWPSLTALISVDHCFEPSSYAFFSQCNNLKILEGAGDLPLVSRFPQLEVLIWNGEEGEVLDFAATYAAMGRPLKGSYLKGSIAYGWPWRDVSTNQPCEKLKFEEVLPDESWHPRLPTL
ncbi:hypothetical protein WJX74_007887 [Apatococcus lobatus]|uniref:Uncharacterized protein n=1 Tax=Apatococcus lobatus TaxID=904363 RepID=A0AAW1Q1X6_9CHLO